ncbi:MAG: sigma-70 family RNA polymerase sigma factor [bacterium]
MPKNPPDLDRARQRLLRLALSRGIPSADAEDLVQDTLLLYWARRHEIDSAPTWLAAVLQRRCLMHWRDRRANREDCTHPSTLDHLAPPAPAPDRQVEARQHLHHALSILSPRHRRLLCLRLVAGLRSTEVAAQLGYKAPSSVPKILNRTLTKLRDVARTSATSGPPEAEASGPTDESTGPFTARELSKITGISRTTIRYYARRGRIPYSGSGRGRRYPREPINALRRTWRPRGRPKADEERTQEDPPTPNPSAGS